MIILVNKETKIIEGYTDSQSVKLSCSSHDLFDVDSIPKDVNGNYKYENGEIVEVTE